MKTFIEDYLANPSAAIAKAADSMSGKWYDNIDDDLIYSQIASPEFRLYENIIFTPSETEFQRFASAI